jgi:type IV pilus assembly protein PilE
MEKMNMYGHSTRVGPDTKLGGAGATMRQWSRKVPPGQRGFTLVELMITVAILAILAAIALASYRQYVIRGNRTAAEAEIMNISNMEQQYFLGNRAYATDLTTQLGYTIPSSLNSYYTPGLAADNGATPPSYAITFTAIGTQASDGDLSLDSVGNKSANW